MKCDKCRKTIKHNELFYGYDRNHYKGAPVDVPEQDWFRFALCKKCDQLLWEFVTGEKENGR